MPVEKKRNYESHVPHDGIDTYHINDQANIFTVGRDGKALSRVVPLRKH